MATERNVVDFKIHNLTEEQFQELKAQGQIDPNAVYCTPDESLKENQITNCITEIPQDIKLELADGVLTLKAGSKVYLATGNSSFPAQTVDTDIERTSIYDGRYVVIRNGQTSLYFANTESCTSGTIADRPTSTPNAAGLYFATDENKMYLTGDSGASWHSTQYMTLPIAIVTVSNGTISSIDKVFNGFGYIGSTVFALPGVKGLIPNGRNADGTLKSIPITNTKVITRTFAATAEIVIGMQANSFGGVPVASYSYDSQQNVQYSDATAFTNSVIIARCSMNNGVISNWKPKTTFHAVDYNDTEFIAHQAMPSDKYVDLTLPASGGTITAPADGYIVLSKIATSTGQYIAIAIGAVGKIRIYSSGNNQELQATLPIAKGKGCGLVYTADGNTQNFRFVYAHGAK